VVTEATGSQKRLRGPNVGTGTSSVCTHNRRMVADPARDGERADGDDRRASWRDRGAAKKVFFGSRFAERQNDLAALLTMLLA
jgi:hypothetical protein